MYELPLFPLHSVLFPGVSLHLHIFEERYKRMIRLCLDTNKPFGVVLIRRGVEALGPLAEPYMIGCTAQINKVQRLEEGRMNISATGRERFCILSFQDKSSPYLIGNVEPFPLIVSNRQKLAKAGDDLRGWVERYLSRLSETGAGKITTGQLPLDPIALAYTAASLLQSSPAQKQEILSIQRAEDLVANMQAAYRREVALLNAMLKGRMDQSGAFSAN